jgi:hypothetical protein
MAAGSAPSAAAVRHVAVLGGGVSGLAAAHALRRSTTPPLRITVLEAARLIAKLGIKPKRTIRFVLWSGEEQGPAPVLVHEPGRRERRALVERVGGESVDHAVFGRRRQHLKQERIPRIAGLHAGDEPTGHEQRKPGRSCRQVGGRQPEQTAQFIEIAHRGGEFALPRCGSLVADHWQARLRHE